MSDALLCESLLAWACWADWHADDWDRNGAFYYRNPRGLDPYRLGRDLDARGELLNRWLRAVQARHRAELGLPALG